MTKEALKHLKAITEAFGPDAGIELDQKAWSKLHTAINVALAQRKPLTDEQIETIWRRVQANDFHDCVQPFARAIEAAHGIKE